MQKGRNRNGSCFSSAYDIEENNEDIRALKRAILKRLIAEKSFDKLDRKLRSELLGLDGACIIGCNGKVQAFGAIMHICMPWLSGKDT